MLVPFCSTAALRGRPRMLVVTPSVETGGAERYAARIALAARDGWEVAVASRPAAGMAALRSDLAQEGIRLLDLVPGRRLRGVIGFSAMLALFRPDVVHLTLPWPRAAMEIRLACAAANVPAVVVHQLVPDVSELHIEHPRLYRWTHSRAQRWVAVSEYGREVLAGGLGVPAAEITVIRNAPQAPPRRPAAAGAEARIRFGLSADQPVVVSVGRLSHEKGHDLLIEMAAELRSRRPDLRVLIAGDGPDRASLEDRIARRAVGEQVRFLGQLADVPALLAAADVFAFPSRMEGTPFALLEAMAVGLPVVATRFGGATEIVDSGRTGVLVEMNDARALAEAVERALGDLPAAREMAQRARATVERMSDQTMLAETMEVLREAAGVAQVP